MRQDRQAETKAFYAEISDRYTAETFGEHRDSRSLGRALPELARVLKPGGIAIITFPNVLNPVHALRTAARPLSAPLLRAFDAFKNTVFASGVVYRVFVPQIFARKTRMYGFETVATLCHGYHLYLKNTPITRENVRAYIRNDYVALPVCDTLE